MAQGVKVLVGGKLETKMKDREELHSKVDDVALSVEKSKEKGKEKTFKEFCDEGKRVDFGLDAINELYRLDNNEIGHVVFKNRKDRDLQEALEKVTWPWTKWDRTPTGKYQLFPHNLTTKQVCG
ncbi:protein MNN4-like [Cucumis melo var. makuwa]|uniref:Protein MNN4-like n=1 Tax=Cucumis melo var. makuwa TaxID=1194695 RepID=A0A5A7SY67_CUCMM|nr:protein MNN4-like [Cucumis melo var. makuwa]TYK30998.1 protein MNN4-like [Cucumis melo var. makuwa]